MKPIKDQVRIEGSLHKVYNALAQQVGYRGWWNAVAEVSEKVGGEGQTPIHQEGTPIDMGFRVDEMNRNESVRWTCTSHDLPSWVGTTLSWTLQRDNSAVVVDFEHAVVNSHRA